MVDANYSVASIFGIWKSKSVTGSTGSDLVGAALSIYSSRTTILLYNAYSKCVEELTLVKRGSKSRWLVTIPKFEI